MRPWSSYVGVAVIEELMTIRNVLNPSVTNYSERVNNSKRNSGNTKSADARSSNNSPNCNIMYKYIKAAGLIVILLMLEITHIVVRIMIVIAIAIVITKRIQVLGLVQIRTLVDIRLVALSTIKHSMYSDSRGHSP